MNETIKTIIDTNITNQTANNSISPTVLGTTMKSVVDNLRPYKVYKALLTQSGTDAPVATILENTLGNLVWSRVDDIREPGLLSSYEATLEGVFEEGKTVIIPPTNQSSITSQDVFTAGVLNINSIFLISGYLSYNVIGGEMNISVSPSDGMLYNHHIEIRVYE